MKLGGDTRVSYVDTHSPAQRYDQTVHYVMDMNNITSLQQKATLLNRAIYTTSVILQLGWPVPYLIIGQLPRVSGKDPERIRVDSVIETFTCVFFILCSL